MFRRTSPGAPRDAPDILLGEFSNLYQPPLKTLSFSLPTMKGTCLPGDPNSPMRYGYLPPGGYSPTHCKYVQWPAWTSEPSKLHLHLKPSIRSAYDTLTSPLMSVRYPDTEGIQKSEVEAPAINPAHESSMNEPKGASVDPAIGLDESGSEEADIDTPTQGDLDTLRRVAGPLPWSAFLVAAVELWLGQSAATGLTSFFQFWCYVTPTLGGIVADQYLGKYNTIVISAIIYIVGLAILVCTSLPVAITHNAALGGLITAMIVIGLGTGGIKSNISPLIAEQIKVNKLSVKTLKSGERVIEDPARTIERVYMIFYLCINIGSLSPIATTELEKHVDFWAAYLLPACVFLISFTVAVIGRKYYVVRPPKGSVIPQAFKVIWIGLRNKGNLDAAKPSYQAAYGHGPHGIHWDDRFVEEMKRTLVGCKVFLYGNASGLVISVILTKDQMLNNFISQAGTMELHGIPNDLMQNIDPLTIIIFIPICDRLLYPFLRKMGINSPMPLKTLNLTLT
ncbi:PTR family peptide transporter [Coccidioides immitis RMSCC 3703]|uniref:PTR family peptide transporter n=1 Tax=Coccidioides immitis RMSCC 3703 TaxID=454286 RepID=A0A0J8QW85_COCIT|nr:PTR family peptide transporter [Coccidioides immitis RMSCC 3703]